MEKPRKGSKNWLQKQEWNELTDDRNDDDDDKMEFLWKIFSFE